MGKFRGGKNALALRSILAAAALTGSAMAAAPASAQALDERFWVEISGYMPNVDSVLNLSRIGETGTTIEGEQDLGLDDRQTLPAVYAGARFGERWSVTGEFYALDRDGRKAISRDIVFDGTIYPVGASIDSQMKSNVYRATVGYAFVHNDRGEFGGAIGLHATDFEISLAGEANVGAATRSTVVRRRDFLTPMPTVGVYGTFEATPKIILNGRVDFLSLDLDDYGGAITNVQAAAAYRFTPMFSAGLAYRYVNYDMQVTKNDYDADIDYEFSGPSIFLRMGFQ